MSDTLDLSNAPQAVLADLQGSTPPVFLALLVPATPAGAEAVPRQITPAVLAAYLAGLSSSGVAYLTLTSFTAETALATGDSVLIASTTGATKSLPATALRALFAAGTNVEIDQNGTISATGVSSGGSGSLSAPASGNTVTSLAQADYVAGYQNGADVWITLGNLLDGEQITGLAAAVPSTDTDTLAIGQGGSALVRQTMAGVWTYIAGKLPTATKRVVELTTATVLDATSHNDAILVCSQPITLTANFGNMGSGFACDVLNLSSGAVTMGTGITVGSGAPTLPAGQQAHIEAITYSAGNLVYWPGITSSGSGGTGSAAVTITAASTATVGTALSLSGTVSPSGDGVSVALSTSGAIVPTTGLVAATVSGTSWTASVTPTAAGTYYAWAIDSTAGTHAVSGAITIGTGASVTVSAPSTATVGAALAVAGTVSPSGDAVNVALSTSNTTVPTTGLVAATVSGGTFTGSLTPTAAGTYYVWAIDSAVGTHAVSGAITVSASSGSGATVTWLTEPSGSYAPSQGSIAASAVMAPGTAATGMQFGWSSSATVAPTSWTAGVYVNTQSSGDTLWGVYLTAPASAGTWYCWAELTGGAAASTVSAAITVT